MTNNLELPLTPYAGTSGWSGSETSRQRAQSQDSDGTTKGRQTLTLNLIDRSGTMGMTWKELSAETGWHHGSASGVLSVLHKTGRIARLKSSRDRCAIYVSLHNTNGRQVDYYKSNSAINNVNDLMRQILKILPNAEIGQAVDGEIVIHTRMHIIKKGERIVPIGEINE